jgi:hypothetical protein
MEIPNFLKLIIIPHLCHVHPRARITKNKHQFYEKLLFSQGYIFKGKIPSDLKGLGHEMDWIFSDMHEKI